ncbi:MAG: type II toxin-antitoxin system VapC family toxin [Candidatus Binataceae bacterium]
MRLLLDTCTFLWVALDSPELSKAARTAFSDPTNDVFLSPISAWEISLKHARGRLPLAEPPDRFVPRWRITHAIESLPLSEEAVLKLDRLPQLHRDPFDRILVCQAITEGLAILTPDELIRQYPVRTSW